MKKGKQRITLKLKGHNYPEQIVSEPYTSELLKSKLKHTKEFLKGWKRLKN